MESKSIKCIFVGYCDGKKAYRFWDPVERRIRVSRDVIFEESIHETAEQPSSADAEATPEFQIVCTPDPHPRAGNPDYHPKSPNEMMSTNQAVTPREEMAQHDPIVQGADENLTDDQDITTTTSDATKDSPPQVTQPENIRIRNSPYPLRVRESKRRWDESMQSVANGG